MKKRLNPFHQELFPANKQNVEHFSRYFDQAGLSELSEFLRTQRCLGTRKQLQKELQEKLSQDCPIAEVPPPLTTNTQNHEHRGTASSNHEHTKP